MKTWFNRIAGVVLCLLSATPSLLAQPKGAQSQMAQSKSTVPSPKIAATTTVSAADMNLLVNALSLGAQPTALPAAKGKYGLSFNANAAYDIYSERILQNVEELIDVYNTYQNKVMSSSDVTEYLINKCLEQIENVSKQAGNNEVDKSPWNGDYKYYYARFVNTMRSQLANVNYAELMQKDPAGFLRDVIHEAGTQQCISTCQYPFQDWTITKATGAGAYIGFQLDYVLSIRNIDKQKDPIFKGLYDAYTAKQDPKKQLLGAYQPLVNAHGTVIPFNMYRFPFGENIETVKSNITSGAYWNNKGKGPEAAAFTNAPVIHNSSFIVP